MELVLRKVAQVVKSMIFNGTNWNSQHHSNCWPLQNLVGGAKKSRNRILLGYE